jgi:hypothetical protein
MFYIYRVTYDIRRSVAIEFELLSLATTRDNASDNRAYHWIEVNNYQDIPGFASNIDIYNEIENRAVRELAQ